jgi:hypothetical protein
MGNRSRFLWDGGVTVSTTMICSNRRIIQPAERRNKPRQARNGFRPVHWFHPRFLSADVEAGSGSKVQEVSTGTLCQLFPYGEYSGTALRTATSKRRMPKREFVRSLFFKASLAVAQETERRLPNIEASLVMEKQQFLLGEPITMIFIARYTGLAALRSPSLMHMASAVRTILPFIPKLRGTSRNQDRLAHPCSGFEASLA